MAVLSKLEGHKICGKDMVFPKAEAVNICELIHELSRQ